MSRTNTNMGLLLGDKQFLGDNAMMEWLCLGESLFVNFSKQNEIIAIIGSIKKQHEDSRKQFQIHRDKAKKDK